MHNGFFVPGNRVKKGVTPFGVTVGSFATEHYFKNIKSYLSPNTIKFYRAVIEDIIIPSFGKVRLSDITSRHLQALIDYLAAPGSRADKNNGKPLSAATVKRYTTVFSSLMTEACRMGFIDENKLSMGAVRYPKIKREPVKAYD